MYNHLTLRAMQVSAYSSFARMGGSLTAEQQRRRMDPASNEPLFTNCTRDFIGTLDYIFYTGSSPMPANLQLSLLFRSVNILPLYGFSGYANSGILIGAAG